MLQELLIKNVGIIEKERLEFKKGLTVLTGETGAGKTMILTGAHLLSGQRSNTKIIKDGEDKASVTGVFEIPDESLKKKIENLGAEFDDDSNELIVSRTITKENKNPILLGGARVSSKVLSESVSHLMEIHGQSNQMSLKGPSAQLEILDKAFKNEIIPILDSYRNQYKKWSSFKKKVSEIKQNSAMKLHEKSYCEEFVNIVDELDISSKRFHQLEETVTKLSNIEKIKDDLVTMQSILSGGDGDFSETSISVLDSFDSLNDLAGSIEKFSHEYHSISSRLDEAFNILSEVSKDIDREVDAIDGDSIEELYSTQDELQEIEKFLKKNKISIDDVEKRYDEYCEKIKGLSEYDVSFEELDEKLLKEFKKLEKIGQELTKIREENAVVFSEKINNELKNLSMGGSEFLITFEKLETPSIKGFDEVSFMLAHPDSEPKPISMIASGGELSRIMLALEVVKASENSGKTFIFDEIDAGIGGETAIAVGKCLKKLSEKSQVIVVTHLPQVACFSDQHLKITKDLKNGKVSTSVRNLDEYSERVEEITRMLSGLKDSVSGREHAEELLKLKETV